MAKFVLDHKNPTNIRFSYGLWLTFLRMKIKHKQKISLESFFFFIYYSVGYTTPARIPISEWLYGIVIQKWVYPGGGGGYSTFAWTGVCRPDLGTLTHV